MDFSLTEEQKMLQGGAREFLEKECPSALVREMEEAELGYSPELWQKMAGLGWLGLPFAREYGGEDWKFLDLVLLVEEMGAVLLPAPFIPTMLGGLAIVNFGSEDQKRTFLPAIAKGELIITQALYESNLKLDEDSVASRAKPSGDAFLLKGSKTFVPDFQAADKFLVSARTNKGVSVFILDIKSSGLRAEPLTTLASDKQWDVFLDGARATPEALLGEDGRGWTVVSRLLEWGACLLCAYMAGAAQRVVDMTTDYGKQRIQFGRPIATFQATSHRLVDMLLAAEGAKFITYQAAWKLSQGLPAGFEVAAAKSFTGKSFHKITEDALRIYGALGSAQECDIQLYYRRATALELYLGDPHLHQEKIAQLMGI